MKTKQSFLMTLVLVLLNGTLPGQAAITHYVSVNSTTPLAPYTSWGTAATVIQDAIDVASDSDTILVTNGTYAAGGRAVFGVMTNRVAVDRAVLLKSVNGPAVTVIQGSQTRCVYLTNGAMLSGFTLTNGTTRTSGHLTNEMSGGGVWCELTNASVPSCAVVSNCLLTANSAAYSGGAVYGGVVNNCTLSGNSAERGAGAANAGCYDCLFTTNRLLARYPAPYQESSYVYGGGAYACTLYRCSLINNGADTFYWPGITYIAASGGGSSDSVLYDCTLAGNSLHSQELAGLGMFGGGAYQCSLSNCWVLTNKVTIAIAGDGRAMGAGTYNSALANCIVQGNHAEIINQDPGTFERVYGGGSYGGSMMNCLVISNSVYGLLMPTPLTNGSVQVQGGGLSGVLAQNCTISANCATGIVRSFYDPSVVYQVTGQGGGCSGSTLTNCIVYYNQANYEGSDVSSSSASYSCLLSNSIGVDNITNEPAFVNRGAGNYRLLLSSPCVNAGTIESWMFSATDLDGNPRIVGSSVDIGAYEASRAHLLPLVVAWGTNDNGQLNVPGDLTNALAISAGFYHSLALKTDGTVVGWGKDASGESDPTLGLSNVTAIAAGWDFSLALKGDGTLAHWGWDGFGISNSAGLQSGVVAISSGYGHEMALRSDGTVAAWGENNSGQTNVPAGLKPVVAISAGGWHSLALQNDGTVVAWGRYTSGQTNVPPDLTNAVAIAAGGFHNLALRADGTVVAWGRNDVGQATVPAGLSNVIALSAGAYHSLALLDNGTVVAWGDNSSGQTNLPANLTNVMAISAGGFHNLALVGTGPHWMRFVGIYRSAGGPVQMYISGLAGDVYRVLASPDLVSWQTIGSVTNFNGNGLFIDSSANSYDHRFYRLAMP